MRIVMLSSGEIFTSRWTKSFIESGHEVHLFVQESLYEEFHPDVKIHYLPFSRKFGALFNVPFLKREINKINPDIMHVFSASQDALLGRFTGFHPSIVSVLGYDVFTVPYKSKIMMKIIKDNLKYYDWIGSTSRMMAEQVIKLLPETQNITVTPFGIDTSIFKPVTGKMNHDIIIGTVKTLKKKYGVDVLIRGFAEAFWRLKNIDSGTANRLKLLIVGDGPQLKELTEMSIQLGISDRITFAGFVRNKDIPGFLNQMDIFVAMSRDNSETFGVAVVEASSCGLPVIVSNVGGLPEVVVDNETGFILKNEDYSSVAEKLILLTENEDLRLKMGKTARKFVQETYEWSSCVETMEKIYSALTFTVSKK